MTAIYAKTSNAAIPPLDLNDFRRVEMTGFNASTRTSQAAIWFRDALYVGTGRAPLNFLGPNAPRQSSGGRDEDGAQVWRYDPMSGEWALVYDSPLCEGRDGKMRARDRSVRAAGIHQTATDREPVLYLGVGSLERLVVFVRSVDGVRFEECEEQGFGLGDVDVPSVRSIVGLGECIYSTPTG